MDNRMRNENTRKNILSLDGGGVRGLSTLLILQKIMDRLNSDRRRSGRNEVKPCDVFDLIGGTSTGGLIAIMLGRLKMNIQDCLEVYTGWMGSIFKPKHWIRVGWTGQIISKYDSEKLENAIKDVLKRVQLPYDALLKPHQDEERPRSDVFVCAAPSSGSAIHCFRSYTSDRSAFNEDATIVEAALATTAATGYFDAVTTINGQFVDGGIYANNPVEEAEIEAIHKWCHGTESLKGKTNCFISIGTGKLDDRTIEKFFIRFFRKTLVAIATETEYTAEKHIERWQNAYTEKRYFRFNVNEGLKGVGLEDYNKEQEIKQATGYYLTGAGVRVAIEDCAHALSVEESSH
ncbi:phospholipase [Aspergillus caelatus]|uniref:Phospholipase n=1 Tax=Aspergillus caelatus TaxID=61420 RepID=A0A5N6ZJ07_9EURO|nr:phospholipase [Aspergillus caelatus]KAE8357465.1 phospholipase [Aspergillus caelatus]